jgi:hypothetical protein
LFFRLRTFFFFLLDWGLSADAWTPRPEGPHAFSYNSMLIGSIFGGFATVAILPSIELCLLNYQPVGIVAQQPVIKL